MYEQLKKIIKREEKKINKMIKIFNEMIREEIETKRTNSMVSLRPHSQTIDSKATRDSSLKRENSDLNKQSSQKNINIIKEFNSNKNDNVDKDKEKLKLDEENKNEIITEEKSDKNNISENIQKNEFTFEEFLNKIINDNYIKDNVKLIYHFCQQCFCFIKVETLFEQILNCYEGLQKDNSDGKLNKLIEFTDVLVIEMIDYYEGESSIDKYILIAKGFYYKLLSDLILNLGNNSNKNKNEEKNEDKNNIEPNISNECENNIINDNKNIIEQNNNYEINKNDLINMNIDSKMIFIPKEKEKESILLKLKKSKSSSLKTRQSFKKIVHFFGEEKWEELEVNSIKEDPRRLSLKPPKKSKHFSLSKIKIKDPIKEEDEENGESEDDKRKESSDSNKDLFSDDSSSSENNEKNNISIKKSKTVKDEKEQENEKVKINEMIDKLVEKSDIPDIISSKEIQFDNLEYMLILLEHITEKEDKEEIKDKYLKKIKDSIKFYEKLQKKINQEKKNQRRMLKRMTTNVPSSSSVLRSSSKKTIPRQIKALKKMVKRFRQKTK